MSHFLPFQGQVLPWSPSTNSPLLSAHTKVTKVAARFMNVTLSWPPAVRLMLTYSLTVSLGTLVGKSVRPWLLQSTVLLLHTHLSGQPEANPKPKQPKITRLLRNPVRRLMLPTPTLTVGFHCFSVTGHTCHCVSLESSGRHATQCGFCHSS